MAWESYCLSVCFQGCEHLWYRVGNDSVGWRGHVALFVILVFESFLLFGPAISITHYEGKCVSRLLNFCQVTDSSSTPGCNAFLGDGDMVCWSGPSPQLCAVLDKE